MTRQGRALAIIGAGTVLLGSMAAAFTWGGYRVNVTPSYPLGLWQIETLDRPIAVGDRIFICPPAGSSVDLARERGYLPRGLCPAGTAPLIKTVVALASQSIRVEGQVIIDDAPLPASTVHSRDAEGRPMAPWTGGVVPEGELFLHSDFVGSYDSRYFGPLPAAGVLGLAREVLTFTP
ncbi:MAG: conjugative transfer signal peptidase TraF [Zhengella sp.]|jgi:conjugative transfer signal peptidase TraF|uniref:Conjugative transfer signal peptidase TraF n=1 Tax=Nitratireductor arenosus TaxID=2682096 RepID=A0A844QN05_9HYPH|nr:conjugative transfer signal peptidase TraF [Nitratireductor arenosus]MVA99964.1 conjugative transfer signal peptidase TraF [Nitratireductor arenosus]